MPDYAAEIASVIGTAPPDLVAYYEAGNFPCYKERSINCLPFEKAKAFTESMVKMPSLGLWMLDDANDSNPYAYICAGPCQGMILHVYHDDSSKIQFSNLKDFLDAMHRAGQEGTDIWDIHPQKIRVPLDLPIRQLLREKPYDAEFLLTIYLEIAEKLDRETVALLTDGGGLFLRNPIAIYLANQELLEPEIVEMFASGSNLEARVALAEYLRSKTPLEFLHVAEKLAKDKAQIVFVPAKEAVRAIRKPSLPIRDIHLLNGDQPREGRCFNWIFDAWCQPGGLLQDDEIELLGAGQHLPAIAPFGVVSVRARVDESSKCAHLDEFVGIITDPTFAPKLAEREEMERNRYQVVHYEDPRFGQFISNPQEELFEGSLLWQTTPVKIIIKLRNYYRLKRSVLESTLKERLDELIPLAENIPAWESRIKTYALKTLYRKCINGSLTQEAFYENFQIRSITVEQNGGFQFNYEATQIFGRDVTLTYNPFNKRLFNDVK